MDDVLRAEALATSRLQSAAYVAHRQRRPIASAGAIGPYIRAGDGSIASSPRPYAWSTHSAAMSTIRFPNRWLTPDNFRPPSGQGPVTLNARSAPGNSVARVAPQISAKPVGSQIPAASQVRAAPDNSVVRVAPQLHNRPTSDQGLRRAARRVAPQLRGRPTGCQEHFSYSAATRQALQTSHRSVVTEECMLRAVNSYCAMGQGSCLHARDDIWRNVI